MTVKIDGMMCHHCEMAVKKALEALPFVQNAEVSHEKGEAVLTLSGEAQDEHIKGAVAEEGYSVTAIA